jgi:sugar O-acyltransferase (sialic acid O-acetyltransferase NeuD family)
VRLYGAGGHARVVASILADLGVEVSETFGDDYERRHPATVEFQPGVRLRNGPLPREGPPFLITVGDNAERAWVVSQLDVQYTTAIHPTAIVAPTVSIGEGTVVHHGSILQANTLVGRHVLVNTAASIDHDNVIGDFAHISPHATLCGHVTVGQGTHIGAAATVIPSIRIGRWCTIGAGAVILRDVPDGSTVVGNPGRIVRSAPVG